jgi:diguanylate cyclase (GGDEF)-like protein
VRDDAAVDFEQARPTLDALSEGLLALDAEQRVTFANVAAQRLLGWNGDEVRGRDVHGVIRARWFGRALGPVRDKNDVFVRRNGAPLEVLYTLEALPAGGTILAFTDLTERRRLEAESAELRERLAALARTDELTGLPNRRAWDQELLRETSRANRRDQSLAVVLLDLDRLGAFNDGRGTQAGDALLRETGAMWRLALRTSDFIARYEDDEFAVLLPDCPPVQAVMVLERLLAYLPSGQTCSAGIAHRRGTEPGVALLARAGEALRQAKDAGGNRAVTAADPA